MFVEPIQGSPQTVVIEHVRGDPCSQQVLDRLVLKVLGDQVQLSIAEAEPIEYHRHRGLADAHASMAVSCLRI